MKLLEDMPSADSQPPPEPRTRQTIGVAVGLLLVAAIAGVLLVTRGGGAPDDTTTGTVESTDTTLVQWVESASGVCADTAAEHPIMTQGVAARADLANLAAVDAGTRALVSAIRDLPVPAVSEDNARVSEVLTAGDRADLAWSELAAGPDDVTQAQITEASNLTTVFVNGLIELGAECSALG